MNDQQTHQPDGQPGGTNTQDGVLDLTERNWLPRHCRGDSQAFEQLLQAYRTLVFTFLCRYGIETHQRDDLFQDIFLKVHLAAPSYRPSEPLRPWIVSIVLNTVRNFRRDRGRRNHFMNHLKAVTDNPDRENPLEPVQGPGPEHQAEQQSTVLWLQQRIALLPDAQREVLVLSTLKGMRMQDIARALALPENTVKTHLRRARLALAESLAERDNGPAGEPVAVRGGSLRGTS